MDRGVTAFPERLTRRRALGALAVLAYGGLVAQVVWWYGGVPGSRDTLVPLILAGFLAFSVTSVARLRRLAIGVAMDWLPFVLLLWLYDLVRGYADELGMGVHEQPQLGLDRLFGGGTVPTVWLQQRLWHGRWDLHWWDFATWGVYMSYFFGTTAVLAVLWWRSRPLFRRFAASVVGLAFLGVVTFLLYPAEPPWLTAYDGRIPPVERIVWPVGEHVPVVSFGALWETGTHYANPVAAMPSLHAAYTLLIALFLVHRLRSRWRHLLWLYPPAMAFALVYSGEHYVTDILLGWIYCVAVYFAIEWALGRRKRAPEPTPSRHISTSAAVPDARERTMASPEDCQSSGDLRPFQRAGDSTPKSNWSRTRNVV